MDYKKFFDSFSKVDVSRLIDTFGLYAQDAIDTPDPYIELLYMMQFPTNHFVKQFPNHAKALKKFCDNKLKELGGIKVKYLHNLPPNEQLDKMLSMFIDPNIPGSSIQILELYLAYYGLYASRQNCLSILLKLCKDGYLTDGDRLFKQSFVALPVGTEEIVNYAITFEGRVFISDGGYVQKGKDDKKEKGSQRVKYILSTFAGGIIGLIGVWLGGKLTEIREADKPNTNVLQEIRIIHDTVYLPLKRDTSLVRIVKRKK